MANSHDVLALRCAVCAHGTATSLKFTSWAAVHLDFVSDKDYGRWLCQHAKYHLQLAKSDCLRSLSSLATLQATALVALYELKQAQFSQAWVTTSGAVWLAQALQLGKVESRHPAQQRLSLLSSPLTPTVSMNTNEEIRTMWAVLTLNCFLCVGASPNVMDIITQNEVSSL